MYMKLYYMLLILITTLFSNISLAKCDKLKIFSDKWMSCRKKVEQKIEGCLQKKDVNVRFNCVNDIGDKQTILEEKKPELKFKNATVTFNAQSGGCTSKNSFLFHISKANKKQIKKMKIVRFPDICEAFVPDGVNLNFSYHELGINKGDKVLLGKKLYTIP